MRTEYSNEAVVALYIRDDAVRALAQEIARQRGCNVTEAVRAALLEAKTRLERERSERDAEARALLDRLRRQRRAPVHEDVLYDDQGQPRL